MNPISPKPDDLGKELPDKVGIHIDYAIIQHFSQHLYGSPNKAIEELLANGYDAFATEVFVYVRGDAVVDRVAVWDDGESMDEKGLHRLWWIARSPKDDGSDRIEKREGRAPRALIGKFGIGKLASYAVGTRITHLCKQGGRFLRVTVDYTAIPQITEEKASVLYEAPILELTEDEAAAYVDSVFAATPQAKTSLWDQDRWTLAVIDNLREDVTLYEGRLTWVIGNGMPYRPDFHVHVNDRPVEPKLAAGAFQEWTFKDERVRDQLLSEWADAVEEGLEHVEGNITYEDDVAVFPALGPVKATIRLFDESLLSQRGSDIPRSFGFFVMVRDRLLNPEDAELYLHPPSYGTFYRSQYVIHADGLDAVLLADRERLYTNSPKTAELELLQSALYHASRTALQQRDESVSAARRSAALLPVQSHEHFREPLSALLLRHPDAVHMDLGQAEITRKPLGEAEPMAVVDEEEGGFKVNSSHPLFAAIANKMGGGEKAREALRAFDLIAVGETLLEGKLIDLGLSEDLVDAVMDWRDGLFRLIAGRYDVADEAVIEETRSASYLGDKPFERALQRLMQRMGFVATHAGASGVKDVLVVAPIGQKEYRFTLEAKGKAEGAVSNDDAEIAQAAGHLDEANAEFAVVVAREFVGFARDGGAEPAILRDCRATDGKVFIATVDVLAELYKAISAFAYPLDVVKHVLTVVESPSDKLKRVRELSHPTEDFDFRGVLQAIWDYQKTQGSGDIVPYRAVWQSNPKWRTKLEINDFTAKLVAMETLARGLLRVSPSRLEVSMFQSPEIVADQIARSVEERSSSE